MLDQNWMKQIMPANEKAKSEKDGSVDNINIADNGGRRKSVDRRTFCYTIHIPERRRGADRRVGTDRRKHNRLFDDWR